MKPHIRVIQRNGIDIFVTSSMEVKAVTRREAFDLQSYLDDYYSSYARRYHGPIGAYDDMSNCIDNISIGSLGEGMATRGLHYR